MWEVPFRVFLLMSLLFLFACSGGGETADVAGTYDKVYNLCDQNAGAFIEVSQSDTSIRFSDEAGSFSGSGDIQGNLAAILVGNVPCVAALSGENIMFGACDIPGYPNGGSCALEYKKR